MHIYATCSPAEYLVSTLHSPCYSKTRAEVLEETSDEQPATSEKTNEEDPAGKDPNKDPIDRGIRWANKALAGGTVHF